MSDWGVGSLMCLANQCVADGLSDCDREADSLAMLLSVSGGARGSSWTLWLGWGGMPGWLVKHDH